MPSWRSLTKIAGSISQRYGSADPDPYQKVTDPQHWFPDPWRFNTDPDSWIRCNTLRIRIQPPTRILLFSSVSYKTPKKEMIFQVLWLITYSRYIYIRIRIINTDPNPGEPNQCGSGSTTLILRKYGNEVRNWPYDAEDLHISSQDQQAWGSLVYSVWDLRVMTIYILAERTKCDFFKKNY
jgi:hypothetical protein